MARARNIKPGFFKNEDLAECSMAARLCFAGLWTLADRKGRLEDRPKRIKGELFAFDSVDVDPLLQELERMKFIERYESGGIKVIQVVEFTKHQAPHYSEVASILPARLPELPSHEGGNTPGKLASLSGTSGGIPPENSGKHASLRGGRNPLNPDSLNPDSLNPGRETAQSAKRGSRLPPDWSPAPDGLAFSSGLINGRTESELAKFRDYWASQPGQKGVKTDWPATWRNWVRRAAEMPAKAGQQAADMFAGSL